MVDGDVMAIFTVQGWHFRVEDTNGELYDIIVCLDVLYHSGIKNDLHGLNFFSNHYL